MIENEDEYIAALIKREELVGSSDPYDISQHLQIIQAIYEYEKRMGFGREEKEIK